MLTCSVFLPNYLKNFGLFVNEEKAYTIYKKNKDTGEISEVSTRMRYFFMGNALVTGVVKRIGIELGKI